MYSFFILTFFFCISLFFIEYQFKYNKSDLQTIKIHAPRLASTILLSGTVLMLLGIEENSSYVYLTIFLNIILAFIYRKLLYLKVKNYRADVIFKGWYPKSMLDFFMDSFVF